MMLLAIGLTTGCSRTQSPAVADNVRKELKQAGLNDVTVSQDRDKGVVTLSGHVNADADKAKAAQIAQSAAGSQVVANEVAVLPPKDNGPTKTVYSDLDNGIEHNLDAALVSAGFKSGIRHSVKNGVITLKGTVDNENQRAQVEKIAQGVPNTQQVVNELQAKHEKATTAY